MVKRVIVPIRLTRYGSLMSVILSKKSTPGDGMFGRGQKGAF